MYELIVVYPQAVDMIQSGITLQSLKRTFGRKILYRRPFEISQGVTVEMESDMVYPYKYKLTYRGPNEKKVRQIAQQMENKMDARGMRVATPKKRKQPGDNEIVVFMGEKKYLGDVREIAEDITHKQNGLAVAFLSRREKDMNWIERAEDNLKKFPKYNFLGLATVLPGMALRALGKAIYNGSDSPIDVYRDAFNSIVKKSKSDMGKAEKAVQEQVKLALGDGITEEAAREASEALVQTRQEALEEMAEKLRKVKPSKVTLGSGLLWGLARATVSGVGNFIGGSVWALGYMLEATPKYVHRMIVTSSEDKISSSDETKKIGEFFNLFMYGLGKTDATLIKKFIQEDGSFDINGYKAALNKAVSSASSKMNSVVNEANKEIVKVEKEQRQASTLKVANSYAINMTLEGKSEKMKILSLMADFGMTPEEAKTYLKSQHSTL
jgi:hypothetical protein